MCLKDDAIQCKVRATLNLIHTMSKALAVSAALDGDLADTAVFNCSELILRAAIELHNDINAAIDKKFDLDFMDITGDRLSEMRLLVEGAITLFEDEASVLCRLARDAGEDDARSAFNDIGSALYCMRRHVIHLQAAHHKEATRNSNPDA